MMPLGDKPKVWKSGAVWVADIPKWKGGLYYGSDCCVSRTWKGVIAAVSDFYKGNLKLPKVYWEGGL